MALPGLEFKEIRAANTNYPFGPAQTGNRLSYSSNDTGIPEYRSPEIGDLGASRYLGYTKLTHICYA